jgi:hypothetical protein
MIDIPLSEIIPQVILSPYVIGVAVFIAIYGSIISAVARNRAKRHRRLHPKKPIRIKKPKSEKPGIRKSDDISALGLD